MEYIKCDMKALNKEELQNLASEYDLIEEAKSLDLLKFLKEVILDIED